MTAPTSDKLPEFGDSNDWNIWLNGFATFEQFRAEFAARELGRLARLHGYDTKEKLIAALENAKLGDAIGTFAAWESPDNGRRVSDKQAEAGSVVPGVSPFVFLMNLYEKRKEFIAAVAQLKEKTKWTK